MFRSNTKSVTATLLAGTLLALAIGTPASAGFFDRKKKYVSATTNVNEHAYSIGNTGRDRIGLSNVRLGATVGDSAIRNAPTVNTGKFDQFRDYRANASTNFVFKGLGGQGRDFTQANTYYNGTIGNNGLVDLSSGFGITTSGGQNRQGISQGQDAEAGATASTQDSESTSASMETDISGL
ncbi:MAG: hypothetical protein GY723_17795 [bacterium]|nr:hypothetical protein [bacterium]